MTFEERVAEGLAGKYEGLANGLDRLNKYIFGIQRGCYTLIGGLSGAAKTTFVDYMLINALQDAERKNIPVNVFYYSYEIDELTKRANWLSVLIYNKYNRTISPEKIKGLGSYRLNLEEQQMVRETIPELNRLFSRIMWRWESNNPTGLYREWWGFMETRGTFQKEGYINEEGLSKERIIKFIPTNPQEYNIAVVDHIALLKCLKGFTLKDNLDKLSGYAVTLRNLFKMTFFFLQQFNQGLNTVERQKFKGVDISPQQSDFRDSTNPYQDSDVVLGLLNAHKMGLESCLGYNITRNDKPYALKDRFRLLKVVKNRLGRDDLSIGLIFQAEAGRFKELKPEGELTFQDISEINDLVNNR